MNGAGNFKILYKYFHLYCVSCLDVLNEFISTGIVYYIVEILSFHRTNRGEKRRHRKISFSWKR